MKGLDFSRPPINQYLDGIKTVHGAYFDEAFDPKDDPSLLELSLIDDRAWGVGRDTAGLKDEPTLPTPERG